jgi:beta-lactamase superfamily II metal-dependent hydrolase
VSVVFTLEALQAFHGDSLLVHVGDRLILVDGGPVNTYAQSLRPRLEQLRAARAPGGVLNIDLAMVSHIDADHILGLTDLGREMVELADDHQPQPYDIRTLWHNAFDDILGNQADELRTAAADALRDGPPDKLRTSGLSVVASVAQGRELRDQATKLGWAINRPFDGLVSAPRKITLGDATITVVSPHTAQLAKLQGAWEKYLTHHKDVASVAAYSDSSVYNLSSIVVLVEAGGKRMLLCGDARGDHVLKGLEEAGLADGGVTKLDILKLPHHGSIRNVEQAFFERLPASHYVISADGRNGNPETATLDAITAARAGDDDFEIHLTNHDGEEGVAKRLDAFVAARDAAGRKFRVSFRDPKALALHIDLADPLEGP